MDYNSDNLLELIDATMTPLLPLEWNNSIDGTRGYVNIVIEKPVVFISKEEFHNPIKSNVYQIYCMSGSGYEVLDCNMRSYSSISECITVVDREIVTYNRKIKIGKILLDLDE